MKFRLLAAVVMAPLCACGSNPATTWATPPEPGATAVAVAESPLALAMRVTTCVARTPFLLVPAAASAIVPFSKSKEGSGGQYLAANAQADCGAPYIVTPNEVATEP
jgi:hypothetical protein